MIDVIYKFIQYMYYERMQYTRTNVAPGKKQRPRPIKTVGFSFKQRMIKYRCRYIATIYEMYHKS